MALVDIGGGTTDFAVFERGSLWHTGAIALGGDHFTSDIAVGLRTPIPQAEKTKRRSGCALTALVDEEQTVEIASVGGRQRESCRVAFWRTSCSLAAEEVFHQLWDEIQHRGYEGALHSGIVLTGGGSVLRRHAGDSRSDLRSADSPRLSGRCGRLTDHVNDPAFATAVGLIMYAHRRHCPSRITTAVAP